MTRKDIKKLIDELNLGKTGGCIITRPLSTKVDFAKIWPVKPDIKNMTTADTSYPLDFYFIKPESKNYIGAVWVTENDLRLYMLPGFQKKNHLSFALKETILPHLLQHKAIQRTTFNKAELGDRTFSRYSKIALEAGFKLLKEENGIAKYAIEAASLGKREYLTGKNTGISKKRLDEMIDEVHYMVYSLNIIKTEIEMKMGLLNYPDDLNDLIKELQKQIEKIRSLSSA